MLWRVPSIWLVFARILSDELPVQTTNNSLVFVTPFWTESRNAILLHVTAWGLHLAMRLTSQTVMRARNSYYCCCYPPKNMAENGREIKISTMKATIKSECAPKDSP